VPHYDEILAEEHSSALDKWVAYLATTGKKKPAVIWHNQGKILGTDEVAGKTKAEILELAKSRVPATRSKVVIQGVVRELGLLPPKRGAKFAGPSVTKILKPLLLRIALVWICVARCSTIRTRQEGLVS
jgi:hypothetical protein